MLTKWFGWSVWQRPVFFWGNSRHQVQAGLPCRVRPRDVIRHGNANKSEPTQGQVVVSTIQFPYGSNRFSVELNCLKTTAGVLTLLQSFPYPPWVSLLFTSSSPYPHFCSHASAGCWRKGQMSQHQPHLSFLVWSGSLQVPFECVVVETWVNQHRLIIRLRWPQNYSENVGLHMKHQVLSINFYTVQMQKFEAPNQEALEAACGPPPEWWSGFQWRREMEKFTHGKIDEHLTRPQL